MLMGGGPRRDDHRDGPTPGPLQGDDYPLEYYRTVAQSDSGRSLPPPDHPGRGCMTSGPARQITCSRRRSGRQGSLTVAGLEPTAMAS